MSAHIFIKIQGWLIKEQSYVETDSLFDLRFYIHVCKIYLLLCKIWGYYLLLLGFVTNVPAYKDKYYISLSVNISVDQMLCLSV